MNQSPVLKPLPEDPVIDIVPTSYIHGIVAGIERTKENLPDGRPAITFQIEDISHKWHTNMQDYMLKLAGGSWETVAEWIDDKDFPIAARLKAALEKQLHEQGVQTVAPDNVGTVQADPHEATHFMTLANPDDLGRALLALGMPAVVINNMIEYVIEPQTQRMRPSEPSELEKAYETLRALLARTLPDNVEITFAHLNTNGNHGPFTAITVDNTEDSADTDRRTAIAALNKTARKHQIPVDLITQPDAIHAIFPDNRLIRGTALQQDTMLRLAGQHLRDHAARYGIAPGDIDSAMETITKALREERAKSH